MVKGQEPHSGLNMFSVVRSEGGIWICTYGGIGYGSEDIEKSALGYSLGLEGESWISSSDNILGVNEYDKLKGSSVGGCLGSEFRTKIGSYKCMLVGK